MSHNRDIGKKGEELAVKYLEKKGYRITELNYHTHWGEIDIIAEKKLTLSFIEVKTRTSELFGKPYEAVNRAKIIKLKRPIQHFLLKKNFNNYKLSLDVISILLNSDLTVKNFKHFENVSSYQ